MAPCLLEHLISIRFIAKEREESKGNREFDETPVMQRLHVSDSSKMSPTDDLLNLGTEETEKQETVETEEFM